MCDTNIIMDVLLERDPFVEESCQIKSNCHRQKALPGIAGSELRRARFRSLPLLSGRGCIFFERYGWITKPSMWTASAAICAVPR